jgi:hypothetical protein
MNVANFIVRLLHIHNCLTLFELTTFHSPCTPSTNYAHLSADCENTFNDCTNFSADCALNFDDCANNFNDQENIIVNSADMLNISFVDFYIPNFALL